MYNKTKQKYNIIKLLKTKDRKRDRKEQQPMMSPHNNAHIPNPSPHRTSKFSVLFEMLLGYKQHAFQGNLFQESRYHNSQKNKTKKKPLLSPDR